MNRLYFGDNLDVLRPHVQDASVDLVYLDPPFNSNTNYNVLFAERDGTQAMQAFRTFLGENDMLAYLAMMAPRLMELRHRRPRGAEGIDPPPPVRSGRQEVPLPTFQTMAQTDPLRRFRGHDGGHVGVTHNGTQTEGVVYHTTLHFCAVVVCIFHPSSSFQNRASGEPRQLAGDTRRSRARTPRVARDPGGGFLVLSAS